MKAVLTFALLVLISSGFVIGQDEKAAQNEAFANMDYAAWEAFHVGSWVVYTSTRTTTDDEGEEDSYDETTRYRLIRKFENGFVLEIASLENADEESGKTANLEKAEYLAYEYLFVPKIAKGKNYDFYCVPCKFTKLKETGTFPLQGEVLKTVKARSTYLGKHEFEYTKEVPGWVVTGTENNGKDETLKYDLIYYHAAKAGEFKGAFNNKEKTILNNDYAAWSTFEVGAWIKNKVAFGEEEAMLKKDFTIFHTSLYMKDKEGLIVKDKSYIDGKLDIIQLIYFPKDVPVAYGNWYFMPNNLAPSSYKKQFKVGTQSVETQLYRYLNYSERTDYQVYLSKKVPGWTVKLESESLEEDFPYYQRFQLLDFGVSKKK